VIQLQARDWAVGPTTFGDALRGLAKAADGSERSRAWRKRANAQSA